METNLEEVKPKRDRTKNNIDERKKCIKERFVIYSPIEYSTIIECTSAEKTENVGNRMDNWIINDL